MRRNRFFAALRMTVGAIAGLVALGSCSVKEDRSDCPCWLTVEAEKSISISGWFSQTNLFKDLEGGFVEKTVPRGIVDIVAHHGSLTAADGSQMDSLFAQRVWVNTDAEFAGHTVKLNKNFATIELDFKDEEDGRTDYDLLVIGTVNGVDAHTLEPIDGAFSCVPEPVVDGRGYAFRAARQKDESLKVMLSHEGETVDTIDLGYLIAKAGFDWKAESLGDITILADLPTRTFSIIVKEWDGPVTFEITI